MEVFRIHRQVEDFKVEHEVGYLAFPYYWFLYPFFLGHTVIESVTNRVDVAFVLGSDNRTLYYYILSSDRETNYFRATRTLAHPIVDDSAFEKCESVSACMKEYIAELRLRALEAEYQLHAAVETLFQQEIEISQEIDNHKITREDALPRLRTGQ
jgi:hypothetical protein